MPSAADCTGAPLIGLAGAVHRITDRQGESGTADLVENLREQARLEQLIDGVKLPVPNDWPEAGDGRPLPSHRLLLTPFRYPPLESGSRFGRAHQRHLFYGARALETALAERAFHALRPIEDSPLPPGARIQRQQSASRQRRWRASPTPVAMPPANAVATPCGSGGLRPSRRLRHAHHTRHQWWG